MTGCRNFSAFDKICITFENKQTKEDGSADNPADVNGNERRITPDLVAEGYGYDYDELEEEHHWRRLWHAKNSLEG
jgi:hypothetical protein